MAERPLWTCPKRDHQFVTPNMWHSCTTIALDDAFSRSTPIVREAFDRYVELIGRCGAVTVIAQKTRIVVMGRVRFAGAVVRRDRLVANFALTRRIDDPRLATQVYGDRWIAHRFEVRSPADLDIAELGEWLCESYRDLGNAGFAAAANDPFRPQPNPRSRATLSNARSRTASS